MLRARRYSVRAVIAVAALVLGGTGLALVASPASADTAPGGGLPETVSADALPTWQVNGVVWSQVVVGNTVYVTGNFTQARPPGVAAGGAGSIAANNIFAYNITTGNAVTTFSHSLNAQGLVITASPDGSKVYVGGDFTTVDGQARNHIAAFNTATGALDTTFSPSLGSQVRGIAVSPTTVYVGGNFFSANGQARTRLAAFSVANGSVLPWAPKADDNQVNAMVLSPDGTTVVVGGMFTTLNGVPASGLGGLNATTGATVPWAMNQVVTDGGTQCGITNLSVDNNQVYGSGYAFGCGNFEGTFGANPDTGAVNFVNDCHGDTYGTFPVGQVLYSVSHAHNCSFIGDFPNSSPSWNINMRHALAFTTYPTGTNAGVDDYGWNYTNVPDSTLLQWFPEVAIGSFTGQNQAAWSVSGNSQYVVLGGEFPSVNGTAQQDLVRFAVKTIAPNKRGPTKAPSAPAPSALSFSGGQARIAWQSAYDMDNKTLTYTVNRSGTAQPVYTTTQDSTYWDYPMMGFIDKNLTPGSTYTYTVHATDPFGNTLNLGSATVTISAGSQSQYAQDVVNDGATDYWRLGESSGTAVYDHAGFNDATAQTGVTRGAPGAISGDTDGASTFDGASDGYVVSNSTQDAPPNLSVEAWIKTTTTQGGKIVGYGNSNTGTSNNYDRHIYMDNAGHIIFGVYNNATYTIVSPKTYNDGNWHQIVGTLDSTKGLTLYIDGKKVGVNQGTTVGQPYTGYWRIGGDNLNGWTNQPTSAFFNGTIDDVSIYPSALGLADVQQQYVDAGGSLNLPQPPSDPYGKAVFNSNPDLYWRLDDTSGTTAKDITPNGDDGVYSGGYTLNQPGGIAGTNDTAVAFNGSNGTIGSINQQAGPTVYSEELWFKTTTTHGGKLIGFGSSQSGNSSSYDRHVYMENSGQLTFGVWTGQTNTATSPLSYNDGKWHYLVATQGPDGMHLYVDGIDVADNPQTSQQVYNGYWRVGGDSDWGGDSFYFNGTIDEVAVYSYELTQQQVNAHYAAGGGNVVNQPPNAAFTSSASGLNASFDGSGSNDPDGTIASYSWDFGDNTPAGTGAKPTHQYAHPGTYSVKLTVTDNQGATASTTQSITVTNTPPNAAFTSTTNGLGVTVDGTGSNDPDGTITSYDWNWGDGSAHDTSGATPPQHTYASSGTYTVTLTVMDNNQVTASVSHDVHVAVNQPPNAVFTDSESGLNASFDGSGSIDPDGTIASYSWDFGDNTPAGAGAKPTHQYAAPGTYLVKLTVTDDQGATASTSHTVTVTNTPPNAAFTWTANGLGVSVDGTGSNDPDGSIASYKWDWGDNTAVGTGSTSSHTYASPGTYTITLTVTDNNNATGSVQHQVTVTQAAPTLLASDDFGRTVTNGWGTADQGGAWTVTGNTANFKVGSGVGTITLPNPSSGPSVSLNSVSTTNADVRVMFSPQKIGNGSGAFFSVQGRKVGSVGYYAATANILASGAVTLNLNRVDGAGQATIAGPVTIPGLTLAAGDKLDMRLEVNGTSPTTLMAKVWRDGTTEPASWQVTGSDSSAAMQKAGSVGLMYYLSSAATNNPITLNVDSFRVYDSTTTTNNAIRRLQNNLAKNNVVHKSRTPSPARRMSPPFVVRRPR
jgi:large repetitive protein